MVEHLREARQEVIICQAAAMPSAITLENAAIKAIEFQVSRSRILFRHRRNYHSGKLPTGNRKEIR